MTAMHNARAALAAAVLYLGLGAAAFAMGSVGSTDTKDADYNAAKQAIGDGKYSAAVPLLQKTIEHDPSNADAWNELGFSYRKLGKFADALNSYEKALAINPAHLGANEYLGELYIQTGDMPKAEERLAKLNTLCPTGCAEYQALKAAIDAKKKSG